jgi:prevent-host-death family protein
MTQARAQLADLANRAVYGGEHIVLTRHGKPFAALISAADLAQLEAPGSAAMGSSSAAAGETPSSTQAYPLQVAATHTPPPERSDPSSW